MRRGRGGPTPPEEVSDLPRCALIKVARYFSVGRSAPSSKEGTTTGSNSFTRSARLNRTMKHGYTFYSEAFSIALRAILSHKLRAFLTLIGIIIGVASVIVVGASISGLNTYVIERVSKILGVNH